MDLNNGDQHEGVEHAVDVWASSPMQAAGLALEHFRHIEWSREASYYEMTLILEVPHPTYYRIKICDAEYWLKQNRPGAK